MTSRLQEWPHQVALGGDKSLAVDRKLQAVMTLAVLVLAGHLLFGIVVGEEQVLGQVLLLYCNCQVDWKMSM